MPKQTNEDDRAIALRITALRKANGLSQTAVADALGVTFQQVQKYEKGTNRIGPDRLSKLAALFQVPMSALFEGTAGTEGATPELFALLKPKGAVDLVRAYTEIESPALRQQILALVLTVTQLDNRGGRRLSPERKTRPA